MMADSHDMRYYQTEVSTPMTHMSTTPEKIIRQISIVKDFSPYPAGRYDIDGDANATKFRKQLAETLLTIKKAEDNGRKDAGVLKVSFDGITVCAASFLDEAFGGLVRDEDMDKEFLDDHLEILTTDPDLDDFVDLARYYIEEAASEKQATRVAA